MVAVACCLAVAGIALPACSGSSAGGGGGSGPVEIQYATGGATPPNEMEAAIFSPQLQQAGVLKNYGKAYTLKILAANKGTPQTLSLLAAGQVDVGTLGPSTIALGTEKHAVDGGFSVIAAQFVDGHPGYGANAYMVLNSSGITSAADLKGKTIGTNAIGSQSDIVLRAWLKEHGLNPDSDVKWTQLGYNAQAAALNSGRIALGTFVQPFQAVEKATGKARVLFTAPEATNGEADDIAVVARNGFLKAHPAAAKAFLADWVAGLKWLSAPSHRARTISIMSELTGTPASTLDLFYGRPGEDYYRDPDACPSASALQAGINAMFDVGDLPQKFDVTPLINSSYLPAPCS